MLNVVKEDFMSNTGLITNLSSQYDLDTLSKYWTGQHALVAQGGGQKGIFTAGVLDALLHQNQDPFDSFYGTSAGALMITAFLCRKPEFSKNFLEQITTQKEFFSLFRKGDRPPLDLDWAFDHLDSPPFELDISIAHQVLGERNAFAAVTNRKTLHDEYLSIFCNDWLTRLKASSALPSLYQHNVPILDKLYVDGGISAAIPAQQAWRDGARFLTIIRTEPFDSQEEIETYVHGKDAQITSHLESSRLGQSEFNIKRFLSKMSQRWRLEFEKFMHQRRDKIDECLANEIHLRGERWHFGGKNLYRLRHLLGIEYGSKLESNLMDMLMVHYQTYNLTRHFLLNPPEDCFILQIAPATSLRSNPVRSSKKALIHDYEIGLEAGKKYLALIEKIRAI